MKNSIFIYLIFIIVALNSCTSTKKLIYLQDNVSEEYNNVEQSIKSVPIQPLPYRIKPQDRLLINVFSLSDEKINFLKKPDIEVLVNDRNEILLPVIGPVNVKDLTLKEAEDVLVKATSSFLKTPNITVKLINFNITVLGEVNKQGTYTISETSVNMLTAIGIAGGVTENANMKNVRIIRKANDTARIFRVNMLQDNLLSSDNYYLQPNDVILINPLRAKASNQQKTATISLAVSVITSLALLFIKVR
ncbi:MAG TPA: polysaccharide biosynthesis/export family protein [Flavisolibacter sp.]|jgi:polysaccharide export outer membrane protein|nr:polysaccharide biosynthesis/export family protein [Flavisolibacter sp.]